MNEYQKLKETHQNRFNEFSSKNMFYAFDNKQFNEGLKKLNLTQDNYKHRLLTTGAGGYLLKEKDAELTDLMDELTAELNAAFEADTTGTGFILEAFRYELANHEYCITYSTEATLDALGLNEKDLERDNIRNGLKLALSEYK